MVSEVLSRTWENLFSWTTLIGIVVFFVLSLLRFAPVLLTMFGAERSSSAGLMSRGCLGMILVGLLEVFGVFYLVVSISPKVLGFDDSAQWLLPFGPLVFSFWTTLKQLMAGLLFAFAGAFVPVIGRFQIFLYTMISILFYRVGYKWSRPEGYRIGNEAYKDFIPEFSVSLLIIGTCLFLTILSVVVGHLLSKRAYGSSTQEVASFSEALGAVVFAIIPIYMYGAWFSLKMH